MNTLRDLPFSGKPFLWLPVGLDKGAFDGALWLHAEASKVPALEGLIAWTLRQPLANPRIRSGCRRMLISVGVSQEIKGCSRRSLELELTALKHEQVRCARTLKSDEAARWLF